MEANSNKIFQISQNFQTILQIILWRNKHKSRFAVFITSFLHLNKGFWLFLGSSKLTFVKNLTEFYQISLKNVPFHRFQSTAYGMYAVNREIGCISSSDLTHLLITNMSLEISSYKLQIRLTMKFSKYGYNISDPLIWANER